MRLIDADKVIEVIKGMQKAYPIEDQRPHARGIRVALFDCRNLIENQPTAYDVEKVISEIDKCSIDNTDWSYSTNEKLASYYLSRTAEVIDIVKRGGINEKNLW